MSIDGRREMTSEVSCGTSEGGFIRRLRAAGLIAALAGAVGSLGLMFRAGRNTPRLLVVIFTFWVLSPFMAVLMATAVSKRWSVLTRATLYSVMLVLAVGSLAIYGYDAWRPRKAQPAFVFVLVPPVSWLLIAIALPIAALISGRRSRRGRGA